MSHKSDIPRHVAIIMDGNGRWAQRQGKERFFGHMQGLESVRKVIKAAKRSGVEYLTLYAFSTENWGRPAEEVDALMELFCKAVTDESMELIEQGVRVDTIGNLAGLSPKVQEHMKQIKERTAGAGELTLILAINYSSRWETTEMARKVGRMVAEGTLAAEDIDYGTVNDNLSTAGYPDPDLLIRTSGEYRLSNFLLLQLAYAELYFTPVLWPDFGQEEFDDAIKEFGRRSRRYGLV